MDLELDISKLMGEFVVVVTKNVRTCKTDQLTLTSESCTVNNLNEFVEKSLKLPEPFGIGKNTDVGENTETGGKCLEMSGEQE
jgi:hypothetical protein